MIPGPGELMIILVIVVLVFGARRIPEMMEGVGKGIKNFKRAMDADEPHSDSVQAASALPPANKAHITPS